MSTYPPETTSGVTTSYLPLTTAFVEPSGCGQLLVSSFSTLYAYNAAYGTLVSSKTSCLPEEISSWWLDSESTLGFGLGPLVCPDGWQTVQTSVVDSTSNYAMCCPPNFERNTGLAYRYSNQAIVIEEVGLATGDFSAWAFGCVSSATAGAVLTYLNPFVSMMASTRIASPSYVFGQAVVGLNKGLTTSTPGPAGTSRGSTQSAGLSTGAKAGIGVGVSLGVLLIIALIIVTVMLMRHRRRAAEKNVADTSVPPTTAYVDAKDRVRDQQNEELDSKLVNTAPANHVNTDDRPDFPQAIELDATTTSKLPEEVEGRRFYQLP